jgi:DNA repair protein RadD
LKQLRPYQHEAVQECWQALRESDAPVLLMASVGAGKSLMLASILHTMQRVGKRALCLVNNSELVRNNCETFIQQGGHASIYCAALSCKDSSAPVVFGTPQSVLNGINKNEPIANIRFNIIVVDEAHAINYLNHRSGFMRILRHYKQEYSDMRLLGATGTNFRFKGTAIVGDECLFKRQVGNITTESLIDAGYLIDPNFEVDRNLVIDFSKVKIKQNGQFDQKQLEKVIDENTRLTELICYQIIHIMKTQSRYGVFIFATTKKHALEIMTHLPPDESALILGETPQDERTDILNKARTGQIKYLVNIAIISVGVDVPAYDTIAYLRPTESLVLLVQTMGRALRLSDSTGKTSALVLDFAGNIERHKDWDNPILLKAVKQTDEPDKPKKIICPRCQELNTDTARRCVGVREYSDRQSDKLVKVRCDYYFEFKECPNEDCKLKNDIAARHCHTCQTEIIDPNKKLNLNKVTNDDVLLKYNVINAKYAISDTHTSFRVNCVYRCKTESGAIRTFYECYTPSSDKAKHVFYGQFIKKHCNTPSDWYNHLTDRGKMVDMLSFANTPEQLYIKKDVQGYRIKKKIFKEAIA